MRPTFKPSARVRELPPVDVRLAPLLNSPGAGAGWIMGIGSVIDAAGGEVLRASAVNFAGSTGGGALAFTTGTFRSLSSNGSGSALSAGASTFSSSGGACTAGATLLAGASDFGTSARIAGGGFPAGAAGPLGITGERAA